MQLGNRRLEQHALVLLGAIVVTPPAGAISPPRARQFLLRVVLGRCRARSRLAEIPGLGCALLAETGPTDVCRIAHGTARLASSNGRLSAAETVRHAPPHGASAVVLGDDGECRLGWRRAAAARSQARAGQACERCSASSQSPRSAHKDTPCTTPRWARRV